jgi:hypothetical protein
MDAGACWREVLHLHRELGRDENALGRAVWTMRYAQRGAWRAVLRDAAAETLREARRAASVYDIVRLKEAAGYYSRLAGCGYGQAAQLMLKPDERRGARPSGDRRERDLGFGFRAGIERRLASGLARAVVVACDADAVAARGRAPCAAGVVLEVVGDAAGRLAAP